MRLSSSPMPRIDWLCDAHTGHRRPLTIAVKAGVKGAPTECMRRWIPSWGATLLYGSSTYLHTTMRGRWAKDGPVRVSWSDAKSGLDAEAWSHGGSSERRGHEAKRGLTPERFWRNAKTRLLVASGSS